MSNTDRNRESLIKSVGAVLLGIIVLAFVYNIFFPGPATMGYGMGGMSSGHMGHGYGYGYGAGMDFTLGGILGGILIILIKLLSILLVVGLVVGLWMVVRDFLFAQGENPFATLTKGLTGNKVNCPKCGTAVDNKWTYCPDCGQHLKKSPEEPDNQSQ